MVFSLMSVSGPFCKVKWILKWAWVVTIKLDHLNHYNCKYGLV
jgi:hypothetical protein